MCWCKRAQTGASMRNKRLPLCDPTRLRLRVLFARSLQVRYAPTHLSTEHNMWRINCLFSERVQDHHTSPFSAKLGALYDAPTLLKCPEMCESAHVHARTPLSE